jgi:hypothetical protein
MTGSPSILSTATVLLVCSSEQCVRPLVEFLNIYLSGTPPTSLTGKSGKRYMIGKGSVQMHNKVSRYGSNNTLWNFNPYPTNVEYRVI